MTLTILERSFRRVDVPRHAPQHESRICGVYMLTRGDAIVYVGSSVNVLTRIWTHRVESKNKGDRKVLRKVFDGAIWYPLPLAVHPYYEGAFIRFLNPEHNLAAAPGDCKYDDEIIDGFGLDPALRPPIENLVYQKQVKQRANSSRSKYGRTIRPSVLTNGTSRSLHELVIDHVRNSDLSNEQIASRMKCSAQRVKRLLAGATRLTAQDIEDLADILGVSINELYGNTSDGGMQ